MSEENAVQEDPPVSETQEGGVAETGEIVAQSAEAAPVDTSVTTSANAAVSGETQGAVDLSAKIAALEPAAQAVLTEVINHIADGFINVSVPVGFLRIEKLLG